MTAEDGTDPTARLRALIGRLAAPAEGGDAQEAAALAAELADALDAVDDEVDELRQRHDHAAAAIEGLEASRRLYRQLFDAAPDPYLVTDDRAVVLQGNTRAREVLVRLRTGKPLVLAVAPGDRAAFFQFLGDGASDGRTMLGFETAHGLVPMDVLRHAMGDGRLLWLLRDITEIEEARRRSAELAEHDRVLAEQLRQLDELRSAFLLAVSHDLRTPVAAVAGLADTLAAHPDLPAADRSAIVNRIQASARRVMELFTDLLDLERLEQCEVVLRRELTDVAAVVARSCAQVPLEAYVVELDARPTPGAVDAVLVGRIVENLLHNVAQHTPAGTRVWVRCRREADGVLIVVEDDGPGVPAALAPCIFELFQRGPGADTGRGLGVGLTLVRRFAELHGGYARLEQRPGGGAAFHVLLPAPATADGPAADEPAGDDGPAAPLA